MPALRACGKNWAVASDDFVIPSLIAISVRLVCILLVAVNLILFSEVPLFILASAIILLVTGFVVVINDTLILAVSSRGYIVHTAPLRSEEGEEDLRPLSAARIRSGASDSTDGWEWSAAHNPRRHFRYYLYARMVTYVMEVVVLVVMTAAVWSPHSNDQVPGNSTALVYAKVLTVLLLCLELLSTLVYSFRLDPLGLCTKEGVLDKCLKRSDGRRRKQIGGRLFMKKLRLMCCCCLGDEGQTNTTSITELSQNLYALFGDTDVVTSDIAAGMVLVSSDQRRRGTVFTEFRNFCFEHMPLDQKPSDYNTECSKEVDLSDPSERLLLGELHHYMQYASGIYGWPLYVFAHLCCGVCQLLRWSCCRCHSKCCTEHAREDFVGESCCLCTVAAIRQNTDPHITECDIRYVDLGNKGFQSPFSLCVDHGKRSLVIAVRGTLSLNDALIDFTTSMVKMDVPGCDSDETYAHHGIYHTARWIQLQLMAEDNPRLLKLTEEFPDYQLVITGHSLGAGTASVLAVLLKNQFPDLVCYAFSPPGCMFSFPLAVYSRNFITSVVLGNEMIPRLSPRSLLLLRTSVGFLLTRCRKHKSRVLLPKWLEDCLYCKEKEDPQMNFDEIKNNIFTRAMIASKTIGEKEDLTQYLERKEMVLGFPPGSVVHIKPTKNALCFNQCQPTDFTVWRMCGEDLCVVEVEEGMVGHHVPNNMVAALKTLYRSLGLAKGAAKPGASYAPDSTRLREAARERVAEEIKKRAPHKIPESEAQEFAQHSADETISGLPF